MLARMQKNQNPCASLVEMPNGAATRENYSAVCQQINVEGPYDPTVSLAAIYTSELQIVSK